MFSRFIFKSIFDSFRIFSSRILNEEVMFHHGLDLQVRFLTRGGKVWGRWLGAIIDLSGHGDRGLRVPFFHSRAAG